MGTRLNRFTLIAGLMTVLSLYGQVVEGAGFFLPLRGVAPLGRAGAVVASAGSPYALWYNPALLTGDEGSCLLIDAALTRLNSRFERRPDLLENGDSLEYDPVTNENPLDLMPTLLLRTDLGTERFALGLGLFPPYGARARYPAEGAQRYSLISNENAITGTFMIGGGFSLSRHVHVGAGFHWTFLDTELVVTGSGYSGLFGAAEDRDLDIPMTLHAVDLFIPSGNAGIWAELGAGFSLGLRLQLPAAVHDREADVSVLMPTHPFFAEGTVVGDSLRFGLALPMSVSGGLNWAGERGDIELDVTWEQWSVHEEIEADPDQIYIEDLFHIDEFHLSALEIQQNWQDSWQIALGAGFWLLRDRFLLRTGLLFEQSAVPSTHLSVRQLDGDKWLASGGLSWHLTVLPLTLDLGYAHIFYEDIRVVDSEIRQINPAYPEGGEVVANGHYRSSVDILGLGVKAHF